ncbi:hypothetical protein MKK42_18090 [Escherichia coli]|uniref:DUF7334 family protein n=1 Tax=Escherichia coli TaxID=562 RepID=UPI001F55D951|nr:hypothetical protein [Escherichia coli]MCI2234006.1 hypothetical protein [Escherichia coli]
MKTTKQKVWHSAKQHGLDEFIAKVANVFPDAIDVVVIETPTKKEWCYANQQQ